MDNNVEITNLIWKSEYNIGNLKIDQEHQKLFSIARQTLSVVKIKNDEKEIGICSIAASTKTFFKKYRQKCDERSALTGELWIYIDGEDWG